MITSPKSETLHIDQIKPYWRNPRHISEKAIDAVRDSLDTFGYVQPIVVDKDNVIIIGHTRYTAMRRLGVTDVDVLRADELTPQQVGQLRVIDNRTHEYAWWDEDKLLAELNDMDDPLITTLFPEATPVEDDGPQIDPETALEDGTQQPTEFICPKCFHSWWTMVTVAHLINGLIITDTVADTDITTTTSTTTTITTATGTADEKEKEEKSWA